MKITTITCDNCGQEVVKSSGDRWAVQFHIQSRYTIAWVMLTENQHLCDDCWPKIIAATPETPESSSVSQESAGG